jgi:hypothetical protein
MKAGLGARRLALLFLVPLHRVSLATLPICCGDQVLGAGLRGIRRYISDDQ